jgi:hypothetical protein
VIPLLALVLYVYSVETRRRNWSGMFAGLAFLGHGLVQRDLERAEAMSRVWGGRHGLAIAGAENANLRPPAAAKDGDFRIGDT